MKKALSIFCMFLMLGAPMAPPASADCCTDFWSCAGAVVSGGLSCVVLALMDTVKELATQVTNLRSSINTQLLSVAQAAQQAVNTAASQLGSEAQNVAALHRQVIIRAGQILSAELNPGATSSTGTSAGGSSSGGGKTTGTSGAASGQSGSGGSAFDGATAGSTANAGSGSSTGKRGSGSPSGQTGSGSPTGADTAKSGGSQSGTGGGRGATSANSSSGSTNSSGMGTAVSGATATNSNSITPGQLAANPTDILNAIKAAQQFLAGQQNGIDQQNQAVAHQVQLAGQLAINDLQVGINLGHQAALAPLDSLWNYLQDLLANPTTILDPTSMVDSTMDTIINNLGNTFEQVGNTVTKNAIATLQSAQGPLALMQQQLAADKAIEAAMDALHRQRNKAALDALHRLLPHSNSTGSDAQASASSGGGGGPRPTYATVMATFTMSRSNAVVGPKQKLQAISAGIAQLKAIRSQAKSMHTAMPTYQANFAKQLDAYFVGKTPADAGKVRDQLIAQAKAHFANDPKTRDAVIQLLTGESNKRIQLIPMKRP
jgi:hypothetical protein